MHDAGCGAAGRPELCYAYLRLLEGEDAGELFGLEGEDSGAALIHDEGS